MAKIKVTDREGRKLEIEAKEGLTLMEPLRDVADGLEALCGGMCSCSTCHIFVEPGWAAKLPAAKDDEMELLESSECYRPGESRLACQVRVSPAIEGIELVIAPAE
ncbi:MAG: ferredoxin [Gammaproteobacteria bacterium]|nr:ferredoxin [Gammaproteobacteria bacterium PRO8]MCL4776420.1 2Fe-2S iron-sulfur cluster binding domain-containing protein [Gammaproteobacteria bacterium]MCQ3935194.1 ferredoxin [Gammaproteobacteria bacterium]MDL1881563.1 2Fe-2S iron-sulfur cluster binding domain-containing protein [Gammaproteobacteria bacterium PRO2]GIK34569.1 MAG: ferredoxin [Gammaproteobacteria bacterium]